MTIDIKKYVSECPECEKTKITRYTRMPMQITASATRPFEHIFIDHQGPIRPKSDGGHEHIFVAVDELTKFVIAVPVSCVTAEETADVFINEIILKFGFPKEVSHDNGTGFNAKLFKEINRILRIKQICTSPYHPQANGNAERKNRSTGEYLRCYAQSKPGKWAELLPYATFSYNITVHIVTNVAPFELVFGAKPTLPSALTKRTPIYNYDNYAESVKREFADAWKMASEWNTAAKETNKKYYDQKTNIIDIKVGDRILVKKMVKNMKFDYAWNGPFTVTQVHERSVEYKDGTKLKHASKDFVKLSKAVHNIQFFNRFVDWYDVPFKGLIAYCAEMNLLA